MEISDIGSFLQYFDKIRGRTLRVADQVPRDRIEWTYQEGKFTVGDLLRHLAATERYMFTENACLRPSSYPGHHRSLADGYDEVRNYMDRLHAESMDLLGQLGPDDLTAKCKTPAGTPITVWKWLRAMVEHEVHHRGQIYLYLGMMGRSGPPLYGLTEEEVKARSVHNG